MASKELVRATKANMDKHYGPGIFAWSPLTDEQCSADSADYFWMSGTDSLRDETGETMLLARDWHPSPRVCVLALTA